MTRWPLRIRLTAGFAVVMVLVLAGIAISTVVSFRAAFDESIDSAQATRLHALTAPPPGSAPSTARSSTDSETITQILDPSTGTVLAGTGGGALLSAGELAAARTEQLHAQHDTLPGLAGPIRLLAAPTPDHHGVAVVASSLAGRDGAVGDLAGELALALPLVLLVAVAGAYLIAAAALRPVERMRARAATITLADPAPRLPVPPAHDEIGRLAVTLNELLGRQHDALVRERRFVADASHELRTPLGLLTTELELALRRPRSGEELTAALRSALEETDRLSRLAQDLLLLARLDQPGSTPRSPQPAPVIALRPLLDAALARYRHTPGEHTILLDCAPDIAVRIDPGDCDRAVSNLLDNALTHGAPPILLRACQSTTPDSDDAPTVQIEVRDHGPGFDPGFLPRAFDRFARADTARTGGGSGLGLAITAALATRHSGQVTATNYPDGGAGLTLTLPTAPASTERSSPTAAPPEITLSTTDRAEPPSP